MSIYPADSPPDPVPEPVAPDPPAGEPEASGGGRDYRQAEPFWPLVILGGFALTGVAMLGPLWGGPVGEFLGAGLQVIPFALLAFLTYLGIRRPWAMGLAAAWLAVLLCAAAGLVLLLSLIVVLPQSGRAPGSWLRAAAAIGGTALFNLAGLTVAAVMFLPRVRILLARRLPIDPVSRVHTVALSLVCGLTVMLLGQLIALGGHPAFLTLIRLKGDRMEVPSQSMALGMVYATIWILPGAWVASGWPLVRSFHGSLARLGVVVPSARQVAGGIVLGLALALLIPGLSIGIDAAWKSMGWPRTDEQAFERLLSGLMNPTGAVLIGVTAGVGEELAVRGLLQPRLGILLSNLFFTSLHALQYSFDGLLAVFLVGMVLGVVRARTNTSTSAIVHGVYDFALVLGGVIFEAK